MLPYLPHPEMKSAKCDLGGPCLHQVYRQYQARKIGGTTITITAKGAKAFEQDPKLAHLFVTTMQRWIAKGWVK